MGKKRVAYDLNVEDKPPNHADTTATDHHHHHHHHHRHHHRQKPKKNKPEARLLHTLNSHFKKLAKCRARKNVPLSSFRDNVSSEDIKRHHGHYSSWFKVDNIDYYHDWFTSSNFDSYDAHCDDGGYVGAFELGLKTMSFIEYDNNEDLFGGECMFDPDLNAKHNMMTVFEENGSGYGYGYGSCMPDPIMNLDNGDGGEYLLDMLELSSQEDMINEFLKVKLFVS